MNAFSINPNTWSWSRSAGPDQTAGEERLDVVPLKFRHSKLLGGGPHCVTLDTRRTGSLQRYSTETRALLDMAAIAIFLVLTFVAWRIYRRVEKPRRRIPPSSA